MRRVLGLVAVWTVAGCPAIDPYACAADGQCQLAGDVGLCIDGSCAYMDDACPSGFSFSTGHCAPGSSGTTGTSAATTSGTTSNPPGTTLPVGSETSATPTGDDESGGDPTTGSAGCSLEPSGPISFDGEDGLVVERLSITASDVRALRISNSPGVIVRDVEVSFGGHAGIVIEGSPNAVIERVSLINAAAPEDGPADASEIAIHVENSPGVQIRNVRVTNARSGIQVLGSEDAVIEDIVAHNCRGETGTGNDTGGDCVLLQNSNNGTVRRFGCTNDPEGVNAHAGVFIDRSPATVVEDGLSTNVFSGAGAGVRVHTQNGNSGVTVTDVDVTGGTHGCFDIRFGDDVTLLRTRCRNNAGVGWTATEVVGEVRVQQGSYYNCAMGPECCGGYAEFDAAEDQFVAKLPPDVAAPCSAG